MVVFLPKEFMALVDSDVSNEELNMAQHWNLLKLSLRSQKMRKDIT
jgi:hypothetical protein